MDYLKEKNDEV